MAENTRKAEDTRKARAGKPSIASHRLFPVVVVLWFGALFGLVSLAIRPAVMERAVTAAGIDRVVPMAAPPLGHTAHLLIVLAMTAFGCIVGAVVARRFAQPAQQTVSTRRRGLAPQVTAAVEEDSLVGQFGRARAIPAEEGDNDESLSVSAAAAQDETPVRRRRQQLALLDEDAPFEDQAPLPGTQILDVAELPLKSFDEVDGIWLHDSERLHRFDQPVARHDETTPATDDTRLPDPAAPADTALVEEPAETAVAEDTSGDDAIDPPGNRLFDSYVRRVNTAAASSEGTAEPTPGFVSVSSMAEQSTAAGEPPMPDAIAATNPEPAYTNTAERIATAPLDTLSHVELLERLAQTIARRRALAAQAQAAATSALSGAEIAEPAQAPAPARFAAPQPLRTIGEMPAALRPHWADHENDVDDALPAIVPARTIANPAANALTPQAEEAELLADGYSSLRGMTKAAPQDSARIDEPDDSALPQPPVFAFPGLQKAAAPAEPERRAFDAPAGSSTEPDQTEQALRAALATLRRMSGAA